MLSVATTALSEHKFGQAEQLHVLRIAVSAMTMAATCRNTRQYSQYHEAEKKEQKPWNNDRPKHQPLMLSYLEEGQQTEKDSRNYSQDVMVSFIFQLHLPGE